MGSPSGGVDSSGSTGGGGPSGSNNDRGGPSGSDRDSSNDRDNTSSASSKNEPSQSGMTGSERTAGSPSFSDAMSNAANGPESDDRDDNDADQSSTGGMADAAGGTFGGLTDPTDTDDRSADEAAQAAARENHPANEFSGLGPSGGPVDNNLPGPDSLNSHRGFGPDASIAGGIDDDVNAGLEAVDANHPANEFSGLGASGGPIDESLSGGIDEDVNAGLPPEAPGSFDRPVALDIAGYGAAGAAGGYAVASQHANIKGINTVADTLGRHPTANLPTHPGSTVSNADYAVGLKGQKTAADALAAHPAKGGAMRGVLEDAANTASRYGRTATGIGLAFDPVVTGTVAAVNTEGDWTEKATAAVIEGAKRADNVAVSGVVGFGTAAATMGLTAGTGTLAAPATGALAGVAAGEGYARTPVDPAFDGLVESARPAVQATFDAVDSAVDTVVDFANSVADAFSDDDDNAPTDLDMTIAP